jgi:hypothetical protein
VDIDEKAASAMRLAKGAHTLNNEQVITFLKHSISGTEECATIRTLKNAKPFCRITDT